MNEDDEEPGDSKNMWEEGERTHKTYSKRMRCIEKFYAASGFLLLSSFLLRGSSGTLDSLSGTFLKMSK